VADSEGEVDCPPLLTGCTSKEVKVLHENALFLHKIFKIFLGRGPHPIPFRPLFPISGSATANKFWTSKYV